VVCSMRQFIRFIIRNHRLASSLAIVVATFVFYNTAWAATQGKWGRTSSATVKITLVIPPKTIDGETIRYRNGSEALDGYCQNLGNTTPNRHLFQFSLVDQSDKQLEFVLASRCDGKPLPTNVSIQSKTTTILVAPL